MKTKIALMIITSFCLYGCAKDSGVLVAKDSASIFEDANCPFFVEKKVEDSSGSKSYRIYEQGATGFVAPSALIGDMEQQSLTYCSNLGKSLKVLKVTRTPVISYPGCFPRAELEFICISNPNTQSFEDQIFIKLTNLKKLLDNGTITKDEFEQQKAKILNQK
ncbi:MAG: SHOCT domain-containing protein [Geobacteraceae bacterium]|nr:SHOCT domain-containing protein [Geobacteraceae bacterium]NTW81690.1 SHOCT domain-containing protein [Geobacteraceae bacterium]